MNAIRLIGPTLFFLTKDHHETPPSCHPVPASPQHRLESLHRDPFRELTCVSQYSPHCC